MLSEECGSTRSAGQEAEKQGGKEARNYGSVEIKKQEARAQRDCLRLCLRASRNTEKLRVFFAAVTQTLSGGTSAGARITSGPRSFRQTRNVGLSTIFGREQICARMKRSAGFVLCS